MNKILKLISCIILTTFLFSQIAFADTIYFYHTDPAGTPIAMTDASGSVVWKADYKPFGEEWSITSNIENNKRFVGKEKDTETGLNYFGARYMSSSIGRFISTDPVGPVNPATGKINQKLLFDPQRLNLYAYGLNNPYKYVDTDGREVKLTSHIVAFGQKHTAILMVPDDQKRDWGALGFKKDKADNWYGTLSATKDHGKLKSDLNRSTDAPDKNITEAVIDNPYGNIKDADSTYIESLITLDKKYKDNLEYVLFPSKKKTGYNSNSYSSGLLNASGASTPKVSGRAPGFDKPVPEDKFE